jgi:hypothetical protein
MAGERDHATLPPVCPSRLTRFDTLFVLQTRSHDHVRQVIEALARKGFDATLHLE